jgi:hypothetical protein
LDVARIPGTSNISSVRWIFHAGEYAGKAIRARLAETQPLLLPIGVTLMDMQESGESTQESGEGKDESIVERMEQAAQRAREESGQGTDVSQADQQQDMPGSPSTDVEGG